MKTELPFETLPPRAEMERAFAAKDASYDGVFYVAVTTTGIFCRPSCASRPKAVHVEFFRSIPECVSAGYRPCKRCRPLEANGAAPAWVSELMTRAEAGTETPLGAEDWRALGTTPERARRWFQQHYGMSFTAWRRNRRLAHAFTQLRGGDSLDDVAFESGYESHSGFRAAFSRTFGRAPGAARVGGDRIVTTLIESPLGPLLAGATDEGVCLLEYSDRRKLPENLEKLRRQFGCAVVAGEHRYLDRLRLELSEYFGGRRRDFTVPLAPRGTTFQEAVWTELRAIPHGETISYAELARRLGRPTAQRAVARANGTNRLCILIPCHRVIGKDGALSGYGGGVWRKRLLLELERTGALPGTTLPR